MTETEHNTLTQLLEKWAQLEPDRCKPIAREEDEEILSWLVWRNGSWKKATTIGGIDEDRV